MYITTFVVLGLAVWYSNVYEAAAQLDETSDRTFACYGTSNSLLSPSCPSGSLVTPYQVSAGAKTNATGCPREIVNPAQAAVCCVFDSDDCHGEYLNVDSRSTSYIYHADCVGRENCVGFARQASNMDINYLSCSPSFTYPDQTNYMFMDFYCIPGTRVGAISSANIQSSTDMIYLRGQDYATSGIAVTSASCSIESDDCDVIISVYAIDLRLANDSTGACIQELSLSDTVFDCSDDNNFKINEIYQSSNNYMTVNLSSTVTNDGYFWIGFNTSSSSSDILTLRCPAQSQQTVCTTTTTEPTTVTTDITTEMSTDNSTDNTTEETTTEMAKTTMQSPLPTQASKHDDTAVIIGCALAFILAVIIAVVVVIYLYRKKCKPKPTDEENSQSHKKVPPSSEEVSPQQHDTGNIISHTLLPAIPNGKPPKDTGHEAHRTGQTSQQHRRLTAISEDEKQLDKQQSEAENQKKSKERKKKKKKKDRKKRKINPKDEPQSETPDELQATYYKSNAISPDEPQPKQANEPEATLPDEQQVVFQDKSHLKLTDEPQTTYTDEPKINLTDELQAIPPHEPQAKHPNESQSKSSDDLLLKPKNEANATPHDEPEAIPSQESHSIAPHEPQVIHSSEYQENRTGKSFVTTSGEPQDIVPGCSIVGDDSGDRRKKKRKKRRTETNNENDNEDANCDDQENRKRKKKKKRKQKVDLDMIGESLNEHEQNAHVKRNQVSPTEGPPTVHQESH